MKIFAERLKELRMEEDLSLDKLGEAIGVSGVAIGRWERCERIPNIENLVALAVYFKVRTDYLVGLED